MLAAVSTGLDPQSRCLYETTVQMLKPPLAPPGLSGSRPGVGGGHLLFCPSQPLLVGAPPSLKALVVPGLTDPWDHAQQEPVRTEQSELVRAEAPAEQTTRPLLTSPTSPPTYLTPYAKMIRPMRTPIVPSKYQTLGSCLKTSALMRMEKPMTPPTRELNPGKTTSNSNEYRGGGLWPLRVKYGQRSLPGTRKCHNLSKSSG